MHCRMENLAYGEERMLCIRLLYDKFKLYSFETEVCAVG